MCEQTRQSRIAAANARASMNTESCCNAVNQAVASRGAGQATLGQCRVFPNLRHQGHSPPAASNHSQRMSPGNVPPAMQMSPSSTTWDCCTIAPVRLLAHSVQRVDASHFHRHAMRSAREPPPCSLPCVWQSNGDRQAFHDRAVATAMFRNRCLGCGKRLTADPTPSPNVSTTQARSRPDRDRP